MADLTDRQIQILKAIIEEFIETAEPVGSEMLDKKYNLGVSPATIRNEMVKLTQSGFLKQPHTSAGRSPTPLAMKMYVDRLMVPKELSVADEVKVKQRIWEHKEKMDELLRESTRALAQQTNTMSLAATEEGGIYAAGVANILDMPEFYDIDITRHLLNTLDQYDYWWNIFSHIAPQDQHLAVLVGGDFGGRFLSQCGGVFVRFISPSHQGAIGIVGPSRLNYPRIIPVVKYIGELINEIAVNW